MHERHEIQAEGIRGNQTDGQVCEKNWIVYNGTCYLYDDAGLTWKECEKFCRDHNASLPFVCDSGIKETVRRFMKSSGDHWAGLYRQNGAWLCSDGIRLLDEQFKDYSDMDCGIFNKNEIFAHTCDSNKECVCVKKSPWQHPQF
ncbi:hypothetical protein GDO86_019572 [Hymenochirus boettgeri]|uniref:C-type lectin domain-containing protein n=1 Tax=Hymenochirus boettgeri TaxID=247094 RepID=A0A8T2IIL9_9PIPI|nr:hypothetical protein GDO86_019572 [Hymenochirus boettgeri]